MKNNAAARARVTDGEAEVPVSGTESIGGIRGPEVAWCIRSPFFSNNGSARATHGTVADDV